MSLIVCAALAGWILLDADASAAPPPPSRAPLPDLSTLPVRGRYTLDPVAIDATPVAGSAFALAALPQPQDAPDVLDAAPANPFGKADSLRWTTTIGYARTFKDDGLVRGGIGISYFLVDDFSADFEFNGIYFDQELSDEFGLNLNLLLRWHFYRDDLDAWSLYADGGAGLLLATGNTPENGTSFNFTTQLGVGASFALGEGGLWGVGAGGDTRFLTGVRWLHVSNANTRGENPGLDELLVYIGLDFPF